MKAYRCFRCERSDGWRIEVDLFHHPARGELRAFRNGRLQWTHAIGLDEIALFASKRAELLEPYLDAVIALHAEDRPES